MQAPRLSSYARALSTTGTTVGVVDSGYYHTPPHTNTLTLGESLGEEQTTPPQLSQRQTATMPRPIILPGAAQG